MIYSSTCIIKEAISIPVKDYRINYRIRVPQVRVIGENGEQLGVMPVDQAVRLAVERSLDLVEVAPTSVPPVCRLLDYGRFRYEQNRKEREARKTQKIQELREVRLRPQIDDHDIEYKLRTARKLLQEGDKLKVTVMFRGREMAHQPLGASVLKRVVESLQDISKIEMSPVMEGRRLSIILTPVAAKKADKPPVQESVSA